MLVLFAISNRLLACHNKIKEITSTSIESGDLGLQIVEKEYSVECVEYRLGSLATNESVRFLWKHV